MTKEKKTKGLISGLMDFLETLKEMEEKGMAEKTVSGEKNMHGGRARYSYSVKIGTLRPGTSPLGSRTPTVPWRSGRAARMAKPEEMEKLVSVEEKGNMLLVTAELAALDEDAVRCEVKGNKLKILAKTSGGAAEKELPVPEGSEIKSTAFKNGILEIRLKKKTEKKKEGK